MSTLTSLRASVELNYKGSRQSQGRSLLIFIPLLTEVLWRENKQHSKPNTKCNQEAMRAKSYFLLEFLVYDWSG